MFAYGFPVEEVLVEDGIVVGEGLGQAAQAGGGDLLQRLQGPVIILLVREAAKKSSFFSGTTIKTAKSYNF